MEPHGISKLFEYGLAGVVIAILFFVLWRILVWVMKWVDKINDQQRIERDAWMKIIDSHRSSMELHNAQSIEARRQQNEAHAFQRQEHEKMMDHLSTLCVNMKQTELALGRINGYKRDPAADSRA